MKKVIILILFLSCCFAVDAQMQVYPDAERLPAKEHLLMLNRAEYISIDGATKATAGTGPVFDTAKWAHRIDSTWGAGIPDADKLKVFDAFWKQIDSFYACFVGLPAYNWDSIVNAMRAEITAGVSKGRFAGIIGKLAGYINDAHTGFYDASVSYGSSIYPGLPVFRGESGKFGACITALADSSAMVYTANAGHPFGLQAGDIIIGYNGIPWTKLISLLLQYQLPTSVFRGSTDLATYHKYIRAAGENWYLFDTINIRKCNGAVVNFPTSVMMGKSYQDLCTEEMPVAGIHKLTYGDYNTYGRIICSGVIVGTKVGYVSMIDCSNSSGDSLYKAVKTLMEDSSVSGLILDIRTNYGGSYNFFKKTFMYLNGGKSTVSWLGGADRVTPINRLSMYTYYSPPTYDVTDTMPYDFHKKIAILSGPGAFSAGDLLSVLFKHNPAVRTFGKSTAGAFGAYKSITLPYTPYYASRQLGNFFQAATPTSYLSHTSFPVDTAVWFTQASACNGVDDILAAAVNWIEPKLGVTTQVMVQPGAKVYPNPSGGKFNIVITAPASEPMNIRVCNALGATVKAVSADLTAGEQIVTIDLSDLHLPVGSYYMVLQGNNFGAMVKKVTIIN